MLPAASRPLTSLRWRVRNLDRYRPLPARLDSHTRPLLSALRRDGIAVSTFDDVFGNPADLSEAVTLARDFRDRRIEELRDRPLDPAKPFKAHLVDGELGSDSVWLRLALHPAVMSVVNSYLNLDSFLRAVDVWLTLPSDGPAVATQLWHRDGDDFTNVKLFVHLSDVGPADGPFCFAPETHPRGRNRRDARHDGGGRTTDAEMEEVVPRDRWMILTGATGTVVMADTCGYHKQLKPETGERLLFMAQYTSSRPVWPRAFSVGDVDVATLTRSQRRALGL